MKLRKHVLSASIAAALLCIATSQACAAPHRATAATTDHQSAAATDQPTLQTTSPTPPSIANPKKKHKRATRTQTEAETLSAINVRGIVGSQDRDITLKRFAPQIEDSITAQNIGQLPDTTISDSLSRVPGVQIGRSGGEGTTVSINGLPQVLTTLNGGTFLSPGGSDVTGVNNFIVIPATLFKGADVIKSIMASNLAGGVSGIINLRTYRPFDFKKGWVVSGSATGYWGDRTRKLNKKGSLLFSYRTNRWGITLDTSYSTETIENATPVISEFGLGTLTTQKDVGFNWNGGTTLGSSLDRTKFPTDFYYNWDPKVIGTNFTSRTRKGLDASFEYKFTDSLKLIADAMFTQLKESDIGYALSLQDNYAPGRLQPGPVKPVITPQGILQKGIDDIDLLAQQTTNGHGPSDALNTNLELKFDNGGAFSGDLRWIHGNAHQDNTLATQDLVATQGSLITRPDGSVVFDNPHGLPNSVPVLMDFSGKFPSVNVLADASNPATWTMQSAFGSFSRTGATMNVLRGDGTLHLDAGVLRSFQFGARYMKEDYSFTPYWYEVPVFGSCTNPTGPGPHDAYTHYIDTRIANSCTGFSSLPIQFASQLPPGYLTFFHKFSPVQVTGTGIGTRGFPAINADVMGNPVTFLRALAPTATGDPKLFLKAADAYLVDEHVPSIYGQFNLSGAVGNLPWRANVGIRGERTSVFIKNFKTNPNEFIGSGGVYNGALINLGERKSSNSNTDWLPALNFTLEVTPNQQARFAYNKTEARQTLADLGQTLVEGYVVNGNPPRDPSLPADAQLFTNASSGNPNLKPYSSKNYNVSYAWFFNPHSMAYLGAFFMDVSTFPEPAIETVRLPDSDGVVRRSGPLSTIVNGPGATIRGLEAQFRTQFTQLPGLWNGLGVNLNYTWLHSSQPGAAGARDSYNAILFYQKGKVQARVAYNWLSREFIEHITFFGDPPLDVYAKPVGYLDASLEYEVNKNISLVFQGTNLTDSYNPQYVEYPNAWWSDDISERTYYAGVRFHF